MSRYLSKAKHRDFDEWIEGYYFFNGQMQRHFIMIECDKYLVQSTISFEVNESTVSQCAKSNKFGKLWEGDMFWDCLGEGIIGVIEWDDDYDGWIVRLVPNVVEGETVPDFDCTLETFRLDEYDGNDYKVIFDEFIGNRHDYKEE